MLSTLTQAQSVTKGLWKTNTVLRVIEDFINKQHIFHLKRTGFYLEKDSAEKSTN